MTCVGQCMVIDQEHPDIREGSVVDPCSSIKGFKKGTHVETSRERSYMGLSGPRTGDSEFRTSNPKCKSSHEMLQLASRTSSLKI